MEKKKIIKTVVISIVVMIIIWCSMLTTDIICPIYSNKEPVFASIDTNTVQKDGGSALYNGLAYSIQTNVSVSDSGVNIENIEVKIFNIFKFTIRGHNHL